MDNQAAQTISAVLTDVDGTLVTKDKVLTERALRAVKQLREQFGLERLVLVGDRGMISHKAIDTLRSLEGLAWITALKSSQIRALAQTEPAASTTSSKVRRPVRGVFTSTAMLPGLCWFFHII